MIVICEDERMGDALCAAPVVEALARANAETVYALWRHEPVSALTNPPANVRSIWDMPDGGESQWVLKLDVHALSAEERRIHPTRALFAQVSLPMPVDPPRPRLGVIPKDAPVFDIVLAPFANDDRGERTWPPGRYCSLLYALRSTYSGCTIAVAGAANDLTPWPTKGSSAPGRQHEEVDYMYGLPLCDLVALMRSARIAVVTVDSGPNRLAWGAGIANHVLLASNVVPEEWASYPGALCYYGSVNDDLNAAKVMNLVAKAKERKEPVS